MQHVYTHTHTHRHSHPPLGKILNFEAYTGQCKFPVAFPEPVLEFRAFFRTSEGKTIGNLHCTSTFPCAENVVSPVTGNFNLRPVHLYIFKHAYRHTHSQNCTCLSLDIAGGVPPEAQPVLFSSSERR